MRKAFLLLAVVAAVAFAALILHNNSQAADTAKNHVIGTAYHGSNVLPNYPIQASQNLTTWYDVVTTDNNGNYSWYPCNDIQHLWNTGIIYMREKPLCIGGMGGYNPTDTPGWQYNCTAPNTITVNVHGSCP